MAADLNIIVNGTPVPVYLGENTAEAARQAALAGEYADDAAASAGALATANALSLNAGKPYPLKQATRNGTTSAENTNWSNLILAARVEGAEDGKVYSLQRQNNEAGANAFGWAINEYVAANMAASNNAVAIMAIADPAPTIDRASTNQTIVIAPPLRPKLRIILTIDGTKLPASGTPINSNSSSAAAGYSWIIDPSTYAVEAPQDRLRLNAGENYPLLPKTRDGYTTSANETLNRVMLDMKVKGARAGKYYQLGYIANGVTIGTPQYGVLIYEFDAATFDTASSPVIVQNYTTVIPELHPDNLDRTAKELSFSFSPPGRPSMTIDMSIDPSKLPADGTPISMVAGPNTTPAKSWIIHPMCYDIEQEPVLLGAGNMHVLADRANDRLTLSWRESSTLMRRVVWARATANGLWTFASELTAPLGDPATATWTQIASAGSPATDWLPPLQVTADASGDGSSSGFFTGGNHGSDGGSGGTPTIKNFASRILIDGRDLETYSGNEVSTYAREVVIDTASDLMGWNTVSLDREIINQHFNIVFRAGEVMVHCRNTALEAVTVWTDYGPQMTSTGFRDGLHFWGGQQGEEIASWFGTGYNSGAISSYPTASIEVIRGASYRASWMDQSYGLGDGSAIASTQPRMFVTDNGKVYQGAIRSTTVGSSGGYAMAAGATYEWRGGYTWFSDEGWSGDIEAAFRHHIGKRMRFAALFPSAGAGIVKVDPQDVGTELSGGAIVGAGGIPASAGGYDALTWSEA